MTINTNARKMILGLTISLTILGITACGNTSALNVTDPITPDIVVPEVIIETVETIPELENAPVDLTVVDEEGNTSIDADILETALASSAAIGLTEIESEGLIFMREEEKLARDVYLTLYNQWDLNVFQNIAASEQTHTDAVKTLLDQYGLEDPMVNDEIGVFINSDLQALYDQLIAQGIQSLEDALKVGGAIEEIDILDLEKYIAQTDNPNIHLVYENLLKGSRNHLRSFVSTMQRQTGTTYQPQYLPEEEYQTIIGSAIESGRNVQGKGKGNG